MASTPRSREELIIERDWLRSRVRDLGTFHFDSRHLNNSCPAANAMVEYALGGSAPASGEFPRNTSDIASCRIIVADAPAHLRPAMDEVIARYEDYRHEKKLTDPNVDKPAPRLVDLSAFSDIMKSVTIKPELMPTGKYETEDPLLAEHQFLRERARLLGGVEPPGAQRCWGISSNALVEYVLGGDEPICPDEYPRDDSDLTACEAAVALLPSHLREKGSAQLERFYSLDRSRPGGRGLDLR